MSNTKPSVDFYNKYFSLSNKLIKISLNDNTKIVGKIISYFKADLDEKNSPILKWRIAEVNNVGSANTCDFFQGIIVSHNQIYSIYFYEDNSTMLFQSL